jgi:hypothetical protein
MPDARDPDATYPPLDTLKPVTNGVWIVDGPLIRFGLPGMKLGFSTRMTLVRLAGGALFVHSPTPLTDALRAEVAKIGTPAFIVGPNRIHYWWIPEWHAALPEAQVWLAPRIIKQAGGRIDFATHALDAAAAYPWSEEIDTLAIAGRYMTEYAFFHRATRTLILTDLMANLEPRKLGPVGRFLSWLGGVQTPHGGMAFDIRMTFPRAVLKAAAATMVAWAPERIIISHGRWYAENGTAELKRAFAFALGG